VDPDETKYGQIAREMLDPGDFIVPHLNGIRYFEKPVLGYCLNAASMKVFGENAFAIRFPSAMAVGLTALMLFFMVMCFSGEPYAGVITSLIYLTSFEVFGIATSRVLDSMFVFFITASVICFFYGYLDSADSFRKTAFFIWCGVFTGLAFLTKGFLAFAIPFVTIVPFLIWEKQWRMLFTAPLIPITTAALVILPWEILYTAS
jgi:4-amino-4-deoxy-L-arabinose transferase